MMLFRYLLAINLVLSCMFVGLADAERVTRCRPSSTQIAPGANSSPSAGSTSTEMKPVDSIPIVNDPSTGSQPAGSMNGGSTNGDSMNGGSMTGGSMTGGSTTGGSTTGSQPATPEQPPTMPAEPQPMESSTQPQDGTTTPAFFAGNVVPHAVKIVNQCSFDTWPALQNNAGQAQPLRMTDHLPDSKLPAGQSTDWIVLPTGWAGRFWARTQCMFQPNVQYTFASDANAQCATGDCSGLLECGPVGGTGATTFAEMAIDAGGDGNTSFHDISMVDGINVPMAIVPQNCGHASNTDGSDQSTGCAVPLDQFQCPEASKQMHNGQYVACKSGCGTTKSDRTCCSGPNRCNWSCPSTRWSVNFKRQCKPAYSYAYDDNTSTYSCTSAASFYVVFCPKPTDFKNRDAEIPDPEPFTMWQIKPTPVPEADAICETATNFEDDGWTGL